jgi:hypothetical protein
MNDSWRWQDQPFEHSSEVRPSQTTQTIAAFEPLAPNATDLVGEAADASGVAENAVVGIMAPQKLAQALMLVPNMQPPLLM